MRLDVRSQDTGCGDVVDGQVGDCQSARHKSKREGTVSSGTSQRIGEELNNGRIGGKTDTENISAMAMRDRGGSSIACATELDAGRSESAGERGASVMLWMNVSSCAVWTSSGSCSSSTGLCVWSKIWMRSID